MNKFFIDTEFIEGFKKPLFGKARHGIELISIGICSDIGDEYYAISKEFDLKEAWNRFDLKPDIENGGMRKEYWLQDNVLKPIWKELEYKDYRSEPNDIKQQFYDIIDRHATSQEKLKFFIDEIHPYGFNCRFSLDRMRDLLKKYGKTNAEIAAEITEFINIAHAPVSQISDSSKCDISKDFPIEFYGYFSDYDWVVFCSLFGRMIALPKKFPMYCRDLKQMLDEKVENIPADDGSLIGSCKTIKERLLCIKYHVNYPMKTNEHNALADAQWNYKLYQFIKNN